MDTPGSPLAHPDPTPRSATAGRRRWPKRATLFRMLDAFAWPLRTSHYVELLNPLWATHSLQARLEAVQNETADARTLLLRPAPAWHRHRPGQSVRVGVRIDGVEHTRTYSISSPPESAGGRLAITVKAVPGGRVSPHLVHTIRPGSYLTVSLPQGDFVLPDPAPQRLLFITAGSGITPVMSMLRSLEQRGALPDIVHLHYAPRCEDVIFRAELERMAARDPRYGLQLLHTREPNVGAVRHFSAAQLDERCADWRERAAYACGPQGLLDAVAAHWHGARLSRQLSMERFHAALATPPGEAIGGCVRFAASHRERAADAITSLLSVAESAGLHPPHGCRMGICHSCTTTMVAGCVRDLRTNQLINEPGSRVQLCVCAAAGDVELAL